MTPDSHSPPNGPPAPIAARPCRDCGQLLPPGTAQGFCPHCVYQQMDATLGDDPSALFEAVPLRNMGSYELLAIIGRGGMGTVYRAQHRDSGEVRALKMISAGELASPLERRRFLQEATAAAGLKHPHIVTIHDTGAQDGMPYYVMDHVPGRTLADAVKEKPMPPHAAAACMAKVASAIQHAHEAGVLHRDLKPSNILLDHMGEPHVTDFGLARHLHGDSSLTGSQQILGSPSWMSPEQAAGGSKRVSTAADVYSLGAILYHLLTGRPPFTAESPQATLRMVTDTDTVPPRRLVPSIPREMENITLKCLEKNPARRYASAAALGSDLRRFLQGDPVEARSISFAGILLRRARRNPAVAAMAVLLALGLLWILYSNLQLRRSDAEKSDALTQKSTALTEKETTLADSLLWQAEFQRLSGKPGQREGSLAAVRDAMRLPLSAEQKLRARNAAVAALALPDAVFVSEPHLPPAPDVSLMLPHPAGHHCATATRDGKITITRISDGMVQEVFDVSPRRIDALLSWSDTRRFLAFRYDGTRLGLVFEGFGLVPWSAEVWASDRDTAPNLVSFHPPSTGTVPAPHRIAHAERDGSIVVREAFTGFVYRRIPAPEKLPPPEWRALAFDGTGDRLVAAAGSRPDICIWDTSGTASPLLATLSGRAPAESLNWEAREQWLMAGDADGRLTVWDVNSGRAQPPFEGHSQPIVTSAAGMGNFRHATASRDGTVRLWDRIAGRPVLTLPGLASRLIFSDSQLPEGPRVHDSRLGPILLDGRVGSYHLQWPECYRLISPAEKTEGPRQAVCRETGFMASLTGKAAIVRKVNPVGAHHLVLPHERPGAVAFVGAAHWLAVAAGDGLHVHALRNTAASSLGAPFLLGSQRLLDCACTDITFDGAPTPALMAVVNAAKNEIEVHRINSADAVLTFRPTTRITVAGKLWSAPAMPGTRIRLSPDGRWLAAGSPGGSDARIHRVADGRVAAAPAAARAGNNWLPVFSRDSRRLLLGGRTAHLVSGEDWSRCEAVPVPPNHGTGHGVEFAGTGRKDGFFIAAVGNDEDIHLFSPEAPFETIAVLRAAAPSPIGGLDASSTNTMGLGIPDAIGSTLCAALPRGEAQLWQIGLLRRDLAPLGLSWE